MMKTARFVIFGIMLVISALFNVGSAHAADYTNSLLMDDQVFDNVNTMNETQIQSFLASKGPCLANYTDVDPNWTGSQWTYTGSVSASHIIYKVAQQWGLNPQVILSTLQKEESLISGTSCDSWRYNSAMGYGCPDSGGCNAKYAGFTRQVLWGSWQLKFNKERSYGNTAWDGDGDITYVGYMTEGDRKRCDTCSTFHYDGYATIDGQSIHLDNGPTASLYTYTPHLNQSFPGIFESWFGSVRAVPAYSWQWVSQSSDKNLNDIGPGETATLTVKAKNVGWQTWTNTGTNPVRLGTDFPTDRTSQFYDTSWVATTRPAVLSESSVAPGQVGTFTFVVKAPSTAGAYREYFSPVAESLAWFNELGLYFSFNVNPARYSWSWQGQSAFTDSSKTTAVDLAHLAQGQKIWLQLKAKNTGNVTWYQDGSGSPTPVKLGTSFPHDRSSQFYTSGWLAPSRPATLVESSVPVGGTGTFEFPVQIPSGKIGNFNEYFTPVAETYMWFNELGAYFPLNVQGWYSWQWVNQYAYTDNTKTTPVDLSKLTPGQMVYVGLVAKNTGPAAWVNYGQKPVNIGTTHATDRASAFADASWISTNRPATMKESVVQPGQNATFEWYMKAPSQTGSYREYFNLVAELQMWLNDPGMYLPITVN